MSRSLDQHIDSLLRAEHADPFAVLGPHARGGAKAKGGLTVRAFLPEADSVTLVTGTGEEHPMPRLRPEGFFALDLPDAQPPGSYKLRLSRNSHAWEIDDPYRFGPFLGELDRHFLSEGTHLEIYRRLGAHLVRMDGIDGVNFAVWAPSARRVSVVGDLNNWDSRRHPMRVHPSCGVWEIFVPGLGEGTLYKYEILGQDGTVMPLKTDPYALATETPPLTASKVESLDDYAWGDAAWMESRRDRAGRDTPISIYEVHLGSWQRVPEEGNRPLTYRELADRLVPYVSELGFTHIELLPVSEHPFDGSWGYQPIGLYAPTSRFGRPDEFRHLVDRLHQAGIGVILDWVAGHFPEDQHGLARFDGTCLYEHADPRQGRHVEWGTLIYNYGRSEVLNYLIGNALFWLDQYHIDGLRVDAVASMLYLDYSRGPDQWVPNKYGGRENLEAVAFLKRMNELVYAREDGAFTVAEESTAWPMVSRPTYLGGLGFGYKWNMGWMHDTLGYISKDPIYRQHHHNELTFGLLYAFDENFVLPLSHDEVVHGKRSLFGRMPGDEWQRYANLRCYFAFMFTHPGKKLLFMGGEFAQEREWNHDSSLDWHLLERSENQGIKRLVGDLNRLYRGSPALHRLDCESGGFAWIDCHDHAQSVLSFLRRGDSPDDVIVVVCNFTPMVRQDYLVGVPLGGLWRTVLNTDSVFYGGSDVGPGEAWAEGGQDWHGYPYAVSLTLPPLATLVLRPADR